MKTNRILIASTALFLLAVMLPAVAPAQSVSLDPRGGHPTRDFEVTGSGFGQTEVVDLYFDSTDTALTVTDLSGSFTISKITVPASALPGDHWVSAVGRDSGSTAQATFNVHTNVRQIHFNPKLDGVNPYENVLNAANVGTMDLAWSYTTGPLACGSPAVVGKTIYAGAWDGNMYALDAETGAKKWSFQTSGQICASPTVVNGIVYFGGYNAVLYALHAHTGTLVWKYRTNACGLYAAPIIVNGTLYQVTGCYGNVYAFDAATGAVKWQVKPPTASDTGWTPAVAHGNVYVGFTNGQMCALDQNTGATKWSYQAGGALYAGGAAVANGLLFFGAGNGVFYALNATTGALVFKRKLGGGLENSLPSVYNGVVYVGNWNNGTAYALDARTGAPKWAFASGGGIIFGPAIANGIAYFGGDNHNLYALDANTGVVLWQYLGGDRYQGNSIGGPTVANGTLFSTSFEGGGSPGHISAFRLNGGAGAVGDVSRPNPKELQPDLSLKLN